MTKFRYRSIKNKVSVLAIAAVLFVIAVTLRFDRLDKRNWFDSDHTQQLLYAFNIVKTKTPLSVGSFTSGSTIPSPPTYLNLLAFLVFLSKEDIKTTMYLFAAIAATAAPLFFLWGVVENAPLSGFIAGLSYAIFSGTIELANVWDPYLAIPFCLAGIIVIRSSIYRLSVTQRIIGIALLCLAGAIHYSFFALLLAVILYEAIRTRNIRQSLLDVLYTLIITLAFMISTLTTLAKNHKLIVSITYSQDSCVLCWQKIPLLLHETGREFFRYVIGIPHAVIYIAVFVGCVIIVGVHLRRSLFWWGICVSAFFLCFAWIFAGQIAFWYLYPFILVVWYVVSDLLAEGFVSIKRHIHDLSFISCIVIILVSSGSFTTLFDSTSRIQDVITTETTIKNTLHSVGIRDNQYVEYARLHTYEDGLWATTAFWLVREWKFHETLTYNDPLHSYDPALINPTPPYRVYVCRYCIGPVNVPRLWAHDGYVYERKVMIQKDIWMYVYRRGR